MRIKVGWDKKKESKKDMTVKEREKVKEGGDWQNDKGKRREGGRERKREEGKEERNRK